MYVCVCVHLYKDSIQTTEIMIMKLCMWRLPDNIPRRFFFVFFVIVVFAWLLSGPRITAVNYFGDLYSGSVTPYNYFMTSCLPVCKCWGCTETTTFCLMDLFEMFVTQSFTWSGLCDCTSAWVITNSFMKVSSHKIRLFFLTRSSITKVIPYYFLYFLNPKIFSLVVFD